MEETGRQAGRQWSDSLQALGLNSGWASAAAQAVCCSCQVSALWICIFMNERWRKVSSASLRQATNKRFNQPMPFKRKFLSLSLSLCLENDVIWSFQWGITRHGLKMRLSWQGLRATVPSYTHRHQLSTIWKCFLKSVFFFFIAWVFSSLLSLIFLVYFLLTIFFVCVLLMSTFCCPFRCDCFQVWLESARFGQPVWGQLQWAAEVHFRSFNGALCRLCVTFNKCTRYVGGNLRLPVQKNRWWMMPGAIIMWIKMKPVGNYDK